MTLLFRDLSMYITDGEQLAVAKKLIDAIEKENDRESMFELAKILEGLNNKNLYEQVFILYKNAADEGTNSNASLCVAKLYKRGKGCCRSIEKSFLYCTDAVKMGDVEAEYFLGLLLKKHGKELALYWLEHAANQNHPQAAAETAEMYDRGFGISGKDRNKKNKTATKYYEKASELGVPGVSNKITAWGKLVRTLKFS